MKKLSNEPVILKADKFTETGSCSAYFMNKTCQLWNALEGEEVEASLMKKKKGQLHFLAQKLIKESMERELPKEDHFLSCSPWQILSFEYENRIKKEYLQSLLKDTLKFEPNSYKYKHNDQKFNYRNKMEFSFTENNGKLSLAFFRRDNKGKIALTECCLAKDSINITASAIVKLLEEEKVPIKTLKSLIVRTSEEGETTAALFLKERITLHGINQTLPLKGLVSYYSDPQSPAAIPTEKLQEYGSLTLKDKIKNSALTYSTLSFFQINIPMFTHALTEIEKWLDDRPVLDFYGGVGTISISLGNKIKKCLIAEVDKESIEHAKQNCENNNCANFECLSEKAEHLLNKIEQKQIFIVDPPRGGLHPKVIKHILKDLPQRIIYLACNPASQARDIVPLLEKYKIVHASGYNFFPRTPHTESLIILDNK